jgi:hypothetical protein
MKSRCKDVRLYLGHSKNQTQTNPLPDWVKEHITLCTACYQFNEQYNSRIVTIREEMNKAVADLPEPDLSFLTIPQQQTQKAEKVAPNKKQSNKGRPVIPLLNPLPIAAALIFVLLSLLITYFSFSGYSAHTTLKEENRVFLDELYSTLLSPIPSNSTADSEESQPESILPIDWFQVKESDTDSSLFSEDNLLFDSELMDQM